jgi:hypothetical protein
MKNRAQTYFLSKPHPLHPFHAAMVADLAYDDAIRNFFPGMNRWNLGPAESRTVQAWYQRKVEADRIMHEFSQRVYADPAERPTVSLRPVAPSTKDG